MKHITIVLGTARADRQSEHVARYLDAQCRARTDIECTFVDVREHVREAVTIPPWDPDGTETVTTAWKEIAMQTDAFVFVLPEYNHGYPGEWKLLMDSLYTEYEGKDAYVVGVSSGTFAGVRVADHVKPVLVELRLMPHKDALYVGNAQDVFTATGELTDERVAERVASFLEAISK